MFFKEAQERELNNVDITFYEYMKLSFVMSSFTGAINKAFDVS